MSDFLVIEIKTLDNGGPQFYQTTFIRKFLEATVVEYCNGLPTPTKVESYIGTYDNIPESKI